MMRKKNILVLGSGLVSRPGVTYLLEQENFNITVASNELEVAQGLVEGYENGKAVYLDIMNQEKLGNLIKSNDIAVSLLPAVFHVKVAEMCLKFRKSMATSSYVSNEMRGFDLEAKEKGLLLLNEMGVDPGLDHMMAMKINEDIKAEGGKVLHYYSFCGGLPAPDSNNNPFGYKFSWSPKGVLLASKNPAKFLENGEEISIAAGDLFSSYRTEEIKGLGFFEVYPNRDSIPYKELYHLYDAQTIMRGTYRYPGWCNTLKAIIDLGLVDETPIKKLKGITYKEMMANLIGCEISDDVLAKTAKKIETSVDSLTIKSLDWLGLFSDESVPTSDNYLDVLNYRMQEKMAYQDGERDMLLQKHQFILENKDKSREMISSIMVDYGIPGGDSSMARTVSLPLAVGVKLMAEGKISLTGVQIPNHREIYSPILNALEPMNIKFSEERVFLDSESIE